MEERGTQQQQHQHGPHGHQMLHPPQAIYGYPIDPSWAAHGMMQQHHMQGYQHPLHHHMEGVPLPPGIPGLGGSTDPLEAVLGPFPCAKLRNLPFDASLEDILILFQGLVVIDVLLVNSGEAFVIFANPMDFQMALQRDRQTIGRRCVEIYQGSRSEYYAAIAAQEWHEQHVDPQISKGEELSGEIVDQNDLVGVNWGTTGLTTATTQALAAQAPMSLQNDQRQLGFPSLGGRGNAGRGMQGPGGVPLVRRTGGGIQIGEHTGYLRMRGLPFSAAKEDIVKFFEGFNPIVDSIVLTYRSDGRATGEAYVGFQSPEDSKRAIELHRKLMGSRYIELFISNKEEQTRAFARFGGR